MDNPSKPANQQQVPSTAPQGWEPRFGIFTLLVVMSIICVLAAIYGNVVRGGKNLVNHPHFPFYLVGAMASPIVFLLAAAGLKEGRRFYRRWQSYRRGETELFPLD